MRPGKPLVRRTPLRPGPPLARGSRLQRGGPLPKVNRARQASEFKRTFGSKARKRFVSRLPCAACGYAGPVPRSNAHTTVEGKGYKGHFTTIIPLCEVPAPMACHNRQHGINGGWLRIGMTEEGRTRAASNTEAAWQEHLQGGCGEEA